MARICTHGSADLRVRLDRPNFPYCGICARERNKNWRVDHPRKRQLMTERRKRMNDDSRLRRQFGLGLDYYDLILSKQGGGCKVCGASAGKRRLHVDHDHSCCPGKTSCGKCIRGLLCSNCNTGLGNFRDNTGLMYKAIYYLCDSKQAVA